METIDLINPQPPRKPPWLKVQLPRGDAYEHVKANKGPEPCSGI